MFVGRQEKVFNVNQVALLILWGYMSLSGFLESQGCGYTGGITVSRPEGHKSTHRCAAFDDCKDTFGPCCIGNDAGNIRLTRPDSFIGRLASTITGSTDTTFYIVAVYFGSVGIKNTRYSIPVGLNADFTGFAAAVYIVRKMFL